MAALFDVASFTSISLQIFRREATVNTANANERRQFTLFLAVFYLSFRPALLVIFPTRHEYGTHPT
jgi:hypothetical protein